MSVQNLRNKFNQPADGAALSSPGTSFGAISKVKIQKSSVQRQNSLPSSYTNGNATTSSSARWNPNVKTTNGICSPVRVNSPVNGINSISSNGINNWIGKSDGNGIPFGGHNSEFGISDTKSNLVNGKFNSLKTTPNLKSNFDATNNSQKMTNNNNNNYGVQNIANRWGAVAVKKAPEISRENLIKNRWNKSFDDEDGNNCNQISSTSSTVSTVCKNTTPKPFVPKHQSQIIMTNNLQHMENNNNGNFYNNGLKNGLDNGREDANIGNDGGDKFASMYTINLTNKNNNCNDATDRYRDSNDNNQHDWHLKWQHTDNKLKDSLAQNQKLSKDYNELERKYSYLQQEQNKAREQLYEKTEQLIELRRLSEAMCKEYDQLKTQYNLETTTMQKVMERASQWYKQNRELKRRSSALMAHVIASGPDKIDQIAEMNDEVDNSSDQDNELEELRATIKDLTHQVSKLQAEIKSNKYHEKSELNVKLDEEKRGKMKLEAQLKELERKYNQLLRSNNTSHDERILTFGTATSNEANGNHSLENRLKFTETELSIALRKAEDAENQIAELSDKVSQLQMELDLKNQAPPPPPLPSVSFMPPPPPPLPSLVTSPMGTLIRNRNNKRCSGSTDTDDDSATEQMANLLGIQRKNGAAQVENGAIDNIINELKGGRYSLKSTEKPSVVRKEEEPPVVQEMMNILGTLRRQPARRSSFKKSTIDDSSLP